MLEDDFAVVPAVPGHLRDLFTIDHDPYNLLGNGGNPFELNVALLDEWAFRGLQGPRHGSASSFGTPSSSSWRHLPTSKTPHAPPLPPTKRKASTTLEGDYNRFAKTSCRHQRRSDSDARERRQRRSTSLLISADSEAGRSMSKSPLSVCSTPEPATPEDECRSTFLRAPSPPPRVTIDHSAFPHIMNMIIGASSRQLLHTLYNTSRGLRALVAPLLESHVVLGLREVGSSDMESDLEDGGDADDDAGPTIEMKPYGCDALPWSSWKGWADPKPIQVGCQSVATFGRRVVSSFTPSPLLVELPSFSSMLAASEARLSSSIRSVLRRASVIDLMGHLRLPPRQPMLAAPEVLRVHIHQPSEMDGYQRVDAPGWDEHTLNWFAPRRLVVLSRFIDYWSTDASSTEVAIAPSCPINDGTEQLVLRIAYDVDDPRLAQSTIRVPTMYRPGLPKSVKAITIILVPHDEIGVDEHVDDRSIDNDNDDYEANQQLCVMPAQNLESRSHVPSNALGLHVVRLGMLNSTASWIAGYLPRGVKFTIVGAETLPGTALNMGHTSGSVSSANDSAVELAAAVREDIVKQRRLTDPAAIDTAMEGLSILTLEEYRKQVGGDQYALETVE